MKTILFLLAILLTATTLVGQGLSDCRLQYGQSFEFTDCFLEDCSPFLDDSRIHFAYLTVPEDYGNPDGRLLKLAIVFIKSANGNPEPDPVIHLSGGPGAKSISVNRIKAFANHPFSQNHDLIFIDFRGIGFSEPTFCPEFQEALIQVISQNLMPVEATEETLNQYSDCFNKLEAEGINLNQYNSATVVRDLEMLRISLGIEQWNLWGISYGTRVAQTYLRDFPESVRCAIIDSPVPMGYAMWGEQTRTYQRSLTAFFDACKESPECNNAFPDLEERFYHAMHSLNETPLMFKHKNAPGSYVYYNFYNMHLIVQQLLYIPDFYPLLPWLIKGIEERNKDIFQNLSPQFEGQILNYSDAMFVTVLKYDNGLILSDYHSEPNDPLHDALNYFDNVVLMVKQIDFIAQDSLEARPVFSEKPSLILVGSLDPITPPFYAHILKQSLPNSILFEFPGRGHGPTRDTECAKIIASDFLNNPYSEPDIHCLIEIETNPINWVTKMYYNPRIATFAQQMFVQKRWTLLLGTALLFLTFFVSVIAGFISFLRKKKKPATPQIRIRNIISRLSALFAILLLFGLGFFIGKAGNEQAPLLLMGLVKEAKPVFYLSLIVLAGTLFSWVWFIRALKYSSKAGNILYGLISFSLLWFSVLIFKFQLFPN
ncbi:MAG: alpha/beta hydrolase [Bacteroidales bacterium]|nr:alpha/beta hydrolase [Bacteroidales bacterium]